MSLTTPPIKFSCINLVKLSLLPDHDFVLRLFAILNDLSMAPYLSDLVEEDMSNRPELSKFQNAIRWYLLRHRISGAAESIKNTIGTLKRDEKQNPETPAWKILRAEKNKRILARFRDLEEYLPKGKQFHVFEKCNSLRNAIGAHYDHDNKLLTRAFGKYMVSLQESKSELVDWHMDSGVKGRYSRSLLMDSVMACAWYEVWGVKPEDSHQLRLVGDEIEAVLSVLLNFIHELLIAYANEHALVDLSKKPDWI